MSVGPAEIVVTLLVVFLLFGSRRLADLGKGIGEGIRGFKRGIAGETPDAESLPANRVGGASPQSKSGNAAPEPRQAMPAHPGDSMLHEPPVGNHSPQNVDVPQGAEKPSK